MKLWQILALIFLVFAHCGTLYAQPLPFPLRCPDTSRCGQEPGQWTPNWLAAEHLKDATELRGCLASEDALERQLDAVQTSATSHKQAATTLAGELTAERVSHGRTVEALHDTEHKLVRRTRWALGSTGAGAALAFVLVLLLAL